ncbi:MAG: hypothetical protein GXY61_14065 [Lentisphaerae bacterium]|nr:hypothetical protein [Lentisphaerota bacterium]
MKHVITCTGISICAGFLLGYFIVGNENDPVANKTTPDNPAQNNPLPEAFPLQTETISSMSAQLEDLQNQLAIAQFKSTRYDNAQKIWKRVGFEQGRFESPFNFGRLIPSDGAINFFEWDAKTLNEIEKIAIGVEREIRNWEAEQAVCIEATDNKLVFEIPKAPFEIQERYEASLESIIGTDDIELLKKEINIAFLEYTEKRVITFSPNHNKSWIDMTSEDGIRYGINGYATSDPVVDTGKYHEYGTIPYDPDDTHFDRWVHLLGEALF